MQDTDLIDNTRRYVLVEIRAAFDLKDTPTSTQQCIQEALEALRSMGAAKVTKISHYGFDPYNNENIWGRESETSLKVFVPTELEID